MEKRQLEGELCARRGTFLEKFNTVRIILKLTYVPVAKLKRTVIVCSLIFSIHIEYIGFGKLQDDYLLMGGNLFMEMSCRSCRSVRIHDYFRPDSNLDMRSSQAYS